MAETKKILIIRFSSFGDIIQALAAPALIKSQWPDSCIHWIARSDSEKLVSSSPSIDKVHSFDRVQGIIGLIRKGFELRSENYTHVYDAHNNIRSFVLSCILTTGFLELYLGKKYIRRSKERIKRFLLFKLRINLFPKPYISTDSFLSPLKIWGIEGTPVPQNLEVQIIELPFKKYIAIAPSAAWPMKTWPENSWAELIQNLPDQNFIVLGGPNDQIGQRLSKLFPNRVADLSGKILWSETAYVLKKSCLTISADTGALHYADIQGVNTIALLGPTAFGRPGGQNTRVLERSLSCRPCTKDGRGKCSQSVYQKCLVDISANEVAVASKEILDDL